MVALAVDQQPAGLFVFEDELRPGANETVARLRGLGLGLAVALVSGDRRTTAERVAAQLAINDV